MSKLHNMRLIEIPKFRAVSSGAQTLGELFGDDSLFSKWVDEHKDLLKDSVYEPQDFLWHENENIDTSVWVLAVKDEVTSEATAPYEVIDFPGGWFLVATGDENDSNDMEETIGCMKDWIRDSKVFEYGDFPKSGMCNMPDPDGKLDQALGISQQQIFLPIKLREA